MDHKINNAGGTGYPFGKCQIIQKINGQRSYEQVVELKRNQTIQKIHGNINDLISNQRNANQNEKFFHIHEIGKNIRSNYVEQ